ncbi:MAG: hypothetical protein RLZZ434_910, partial [Pseudomonadota bacterium]
IPTAAYATFTDAKLAHDYVNQQGAPIVIKADGLAAGKGVVVAMTASEAHDAIDAMLSDNKLGSAGARVVIEEFLTGEEASFIVMVDGKNILPLATSQTAKISYLWPPAKTTNACKTATKARTRAAWVPIHRHRW